MSDYERSCESDWGVPQFQVEGLDSVDACSVTRTASEGLPSASASMIVEAFALLYLGAKETPSKLTSASSHFESG